MDLKQIEALAKLMDKHALGSIELWEGEDGIVLTKAAPYGDWAVPAMPAQAAAPAAAAPVAESTPAPAAPAIDENTLTSPLVGTVYLAPAPGSANFVAPGAAVAKGQVLCIVEAMKVMNEFTAPRAGTIAEICVGNGQMVEFGQPLFRLQ